MCGGYLNTCYNGFRGFHLGRLHGHHHGHHYGHHHGGRHVGRRAFWGALGGGMLANMLGGVFNRMGVINPFGISSAYPNMYSMNPFAQYNTGVYDGYNAGYQNGYLDGWLS